MRLTFQTDYSFRVLIFLSTFSGRRATIQEIAQCYGISQNHLMKVINLLASEGFIRTTRGRGGGLTLAKPPDQIGLGDVVRKLERDLSIVECFRIDRSCRIEAACGLPAVLERALNAFLAELDRWTLADLVRQPNSLADLLGPAARAAGSEGQDARPLQ
jgi:Rrf2 family nitric oxide-sensitive transcriptional repressor